MATTYIQPADTITVTAPKAWSAGGIYKVGAAMVGVAPAAVASGQPGVLVLGGVWTVAKTATQAWAVGQALYLDDGNDRVDTTATTAYTFCGIAAAAAATAATTGALILNHGRR